MMEAAYEMLASRKILVIDKGTFDTMYQRAFPAQRMLDITLPIPAVFKDGVFYIPDGSLAIKYPSATEDFNPVVPNIPNSVFKIIEEYQRKADEMTGANPSNV
jgi:hypothetical protein